MDLMPAQVYCALGRRGRHGMQCSATGTFFVPLAPQPQIMLETWSPALGLPGTLLEPLMFPCVRCASSTMTAFSCFFSSLHLSFSAFWRIIDTFNGIKHRSQLIARNVVSSFPTAGWYTRLFEREKLQQPSAVTFDD